MGASRPARLQLYKIIINCHLRWSGHQLGSFFLSRTIQNIENKLSSAINSDPGRGDDFTELSIQI